MTYEQIRAQLIDLITNLETFKQQLRPGDLSNEAVCARMDLGYLIRDLHRGERFLTQTVQPLTTGVI